MFSPTSLLAFLLIWLFTFFPSYPSLLLSYSLHSLFFIDLPTFLPNSSLYSSTPTFLSTPFHGLLHRSNIFLYSFYIPFLLPPHLLTILSTAYLPTYLPNKPLTYRSIYLPIFVPTFASVYIPTYFPSYQPTRRPSSLLT